MMSSNSSNNNGKSSISSPSQNHRTRSELSCDTNCSSNSSCFFKKRKPMNPLAYPLKKAFNNSINNSAVKQRVMSAKLLKLRQIQSQLNDANFHLAELIRENQTLKTLQKRQDKALSKYEDTKADLPRLIHSYEEERRNLNERNKNLKKILKDVNEQLKIKEDELTRVKDQLGHLEKLNKSKHLTEREKLNDLMEEYKIRLEKREDEVNLLNRKLMLERKASKQRLNTEYFKYKQCQTELGHAFDEIDRLTALLDSKENVVRPRLNDRLLFPQRMEPAAVKGAKNSLLSLAKSKRKLFNNDTNKLEINNKVPVTDVKLEPLTLSSSSSSSVVKEAANNGEFKPTPEENIRQSGSITNLQETEISPPPQITNKSRPNSAIIRLEKLEFNKTDGATEEAAQVETPKEEFDKVDEFEKKLQLEDKNLSEYCSEVFKSVKSCSKVIELHKESLKESQNDTDTLLTAFKETEKVEAKLKKSFLLESNDDINLVKDILNEEHKFQMENIDKDFAASSNIGTKRRNSLMNKEKLLATLRAIDNGDSVESVEETPQKNPIFKPVF